MVELTIEWYDSIFGKGEFDRMTRKLGEYVRKNRIIEKIEEIRRLERIERQYTHPQEMIDAALSAEFNRMNPRRKKEPEKPTEIDLNLN